MTLVVNHPSGQRIVEIGSGAASATGRDTSLSERVQVAAFVLSSLVGLGALSRAPVVGLKLETLAAPIAIAGVLLFVVALCQSVRHEVSVSFPLLAHIAFMVMTLAWASDPSASQIELTRAIAWGAVALATFAGLDMPARRSALRLLAQTLIVLGLLTCLLMPSIAVGVVDPLVYEEFEVAGWRGLFVHKNPFGITTAIAAVFIAGLERRRLIRWGFVLTALLMVFMSQSATALSAMAVGLLVFWMAQPRWQTSQSRTHFLLALATVVVVLSALSTWLFEIALGILGKDATLTGRIEIWQFSADLIGRRPFTGYGMVPYGSEADLALDNEVRSSVGFVVNHAHNGVLQLLLQGGIIGFVPVLFLIVMTLRQVLSRGTADVRWAIGAIAVLLVGSGSESVLGLPWLILFPIMAAALPARDEP